MRKVAFMGMGMGMLTLAGPVAGQPSPAAPLFITTDRPTLELVIGQPERAVRWKLISEAGIVDTGRGRSDADGDLRLTPSVPATRHAVELVLDIQPVAPEIKAYHRAKVWLLPSDPLRSLRDRLGVNTLKTTPEGLWAGVLTRYALPHGIAPTTPKHMAGPLIVDIAGKPPAEVWVCQSTAAEPESTPSPRSLLRSTAAPSTDRLQPYLAPSLADTELKLSWFSAGPPDVVLSQPRGVTRLSLLAGYFAEDGRCYPGLIEAHDHGGRDLLLWVVAERIPEDDPRWGVILRISLQWVLARPPAPGPTLPTASTIEP